MCSSPQSLREPVLQRRVAAELAAGETLALCLDFDGTLSPIRADPTAATLASENRRLLTAFRDHPATEVAVISGRALADVRDRVGIEGLTYAGNHGLELQRDGRTVIHPLAAACEPTIRSVVETVRDSLADIDGAFVEDKDVTATIHYRGVASQQVEAVHRAVDRAVADADRPVQVGDGKEILEVRPAVSWDKGAIVELVDESAGPGATTVYIGDDTTDEAAFRAVGRSGASVHVGTTSETTAAYQLSDPEAVTAFLGRLWAELASSADVEG
ncbi:trehalose-phosphatase [Haladaptatus sp. DYSN1]|uniref:trehalose-phosphatase n=1 Tax=unclassified Haladaptatus TaxID=2622732 RepID=UPI0024067780|nr:trehalose-phosphatase [Haladaptatus sp. DYSN1]